MRDPFVFDSRSEFCKKPFGAAPAAARSYFMSVPSPGMAIPAVSWWRGGSFPVKRSRWSFCQRLWTVSVPASPASSPPPQNRSCSGIISA